MATTARTASSGNHPVALERKSSFVSVAGGAGTTVTTPIQASARPAEADRQGSQRVQTSYGPPVTAGTTNVVRPSPFKSTSTSPTFTPDEMSCPSATRKSGRRMPAAKGMLPVPMDLPMITAPGAARLGLNSNRSAALTDAGRAAANPRSLLLRSLHLRSDRSVQDPRMFQPDHSHSEPMIPTFARSIELITIAAERDEIGRPLLSSDPPTICHRTGRPQRTPPKPLRGTLEGESPGAGNDLSDDPEGIEIDVDRPVHQWWSARSLVGSGMTLVCDMHTSEQPGTDAAHGRHETDDCSPER